MRRADRVAGLLLLVFGVWYGAVAFAYYPYASSTGPGSGFLPFWLAAVMAVLGALLAGSARGNGHESGVAWLPRGRGLVRLVSVLGATAVFIALLRVLGMSVTTVLFLLVLLRFVERYPWGQALGIAVATAVVNYLVFTYWLRVPFPVGVLGI